MYENVGESIKNVVSIIVKIGYVMSTISAIGILIGGLAAGHFGVFLLALIVAAIVGGLGFLASWLGGLWLYAYGEITDRLISIDEKLEAKEPVKKETPFCATSSTPGSGVYCKACGAKNSPNARYCIGCSEELLFSEPVKVPSGGWKCTCGRVNASYVTTCSCGLNKREVVKQ